VFTPSAFFIVKYNADAFDLDFLVLEFVLKIVGLAHGFFYLGGENVRRLIGEIQSTKRSDGSYFFLLGR